MAATSRPGLDHHRPLIVQPPGRKGGRPLLPPADWLQDFHELEELLGERVEDGLVPLRSRVEERRSAGIVAIASAAREHFGLAEHEPVHDICGLLESRGVKVFAVRVTNDALLGLSVGSEDGGPAVVVNTWDRLAVEHWIYSAVHELGHLLLHLDAYDVDIEEEDADQEREAESSRHTS